MTIVDNNVLSSLAKIDRLGYLNHVFDAPVTTPSVINELHRDTVAGYDFVARIDEVKRYNDGWLGIVSLDETEVELAEEIVDQSLSFTDAECIAVAERRTDRLLTDDGHVGEIASQRGIEAWDLKLFLEACLYTELIETESELETVITHLRDRDGYRFSDDDRTDLFDRL